MNEKTVTYVEFWFRGFVMDESSRLRVDSRDTALLDVPPNAYAYQFFDILEAKVNGVSVSSGRLNESPRHFVGGRVMTLEEVEREFPEHDTLLWNMRANHYDRVIHTRANHWLPFLLGDVQDAQP